MGRKRPERDQVELALKENPRKKAHEIAAEAGLIETMDYDRAVDYVKQVKRSLKAQGLLPMANYSSDKERLQDITTLLRIRKGKRPTAINLMLLLNCYYRLRSHDDNIHMRAIDDTYARNELLKEPVPMAEAIRICEIALTHYMDSIDEEKNAAARKRGFPGAGLNYSDDTFINKLQITDEELPMMVSIKGRS